MLNVNPEIYVPQTKSMQTPTLVIDLLPLPFSFSLLFLWISRKLSLGAKSGERERERSSQGRCHNRICWEDILLHQFSTQFGVHRLKIQLYNTLKRCLVGITISWRLARGAIEGSEAHLSFFFLALFSLVSDSNKKNAGRVKAEKCREETRRESQRGGGYRFRRRRRGRQSLRVTV